MRFKAILMLIFVVLLVSCSRETEKKVEIQKESEQKTTIAEEKEQIQVKAEPKPATVNIINSQYVPAVLNVKTGIEVKWVNKDALKHLIISDSDEFFDSTTLDQGQSHTYVFETPGEYKYHDGFKPLVKGTIIVN